VTDALAAVAESRDVVARRAGDGPPRRAGRRGLAGAALLLASVLAGWALTAADGGTTAAAIPLGLPAPAAPALAVPRPRALAPVAAPTATWAPVRRAVVARRRPSGGAARVGRLRLRTPERTTNIVLVTGRRRDARGLLWTRVRLPGVTGTAAGWVPRSALGGLTSVRTRLVVDLRRQRATLLRGGLVVWQAPVGVGTRSAPTPRGSFFVRSRLERYRSPAYGPVAFGTSARSPQLTDWPDGAVVGIHGTDAPELLPGRVSHGCIRVRNPDLRRLDRRMPIGTPVVVR
jgi:lipoprotein-anchoring transpeptidase ErfK/SrfK